MKVTVADPNSGTPGRYTTTWWECETVEVKAGVVHMVNAYAEQIIYANGLSHVPPKPRPDDEMDVYLFPGPNAIVRVKYRD